MAVFLKELTICATTDFRISVLLFDQSNFIFYNMPIEYINVRSLQS